jgi:hypothetical protein
MSMHKNSRAAYAAEQETMGRRALACLEAVRELGYATDRQVRDHLAMHDMNAVRPRLTELVQAGWLAECGEVLDFATHKQVRVLRCTTAEERAARAAAFIQDGAAQLALEWTGGRA